MQIVDVAIVGGGPAGSSCAAFCAAAGLRTAVIEREKFPREKVCGDCINPGCLPLLQRLGIDQETETWPHALVNAVDFVAVTGRVVRANFPEGVKFLTIKRSILDDWLLSRARELGTEVHEDTTVVALHQTRDRDWSIDVVQDTFRARVLVAADGRNSTVARLCKLLPMPERERVALQAHVPLPRDFGNRIVLEFLAEGYSGQAPVNETELNLCLVGKPATIASLRNWAEQKFELRSDQPWRTITPLTRPPVSSTHSNLIFIGDAARVVEPFTGEGIYYALRSGELAANAIVKMLREQDPKSARREFAQSHRAMYRGRLWINQLARHAVLHPQVASRLITLSPIAGPFLRTLTRKIVKPIAGQP